MDADSLAPRRAMPRVRNATRELEDARPNMSEKLFSTDPHCARVTWFRNWSVHLKLSIEKWLLIIRPNCRPIGLIPATPTPGPQRTNSKFSILNWAMHLTPARGTERGCGRRPSRSAWQMRKTSEPLHALRLVLRTQPRSDRPTCVKCIALKAKDSGTRFATRRRLDFGLRPGSFLPLLLRAGRGGFAGGDAQCDGAIELARRIAQFREHIPQRGQRARRRDEVGPADGGGSTDTEVQQIAQSKIRRHRDLDSGRIRFWGHE